MLAKVEDTYGVCELGSTWPPTDVSCIGIYPLGDPGMPRCFVIQRFDKGPYDNRYTDVLAPAIRQAGLDPYRVDEDPTATVVIEDVESGIRESQICLADITLDNPNIWYEVGFALANGKQVLLICRDPRPTPFPFDVQHRHVIKYSLESPRDFDVLGKEISSRLKALANKHHSIPDNSSNSVKMLSEEVSSLRKELNEIVRTITAVPRPASENVPGELLDIPLKGLEGIWQDRFGAVFCAKVVGEKLLIPYDYRRIGKATSHLYNCTLIGTTLFCRFAWFESSLSGIMVLKIMSKSQLSGGWWRAKDAPPPLLRGEIGKSDALGRFDQTIDLTMTGGVSEFPEWAKKYFANPERYPIAAERLNDALP
jgi:hypothetical protein